MKTVTNMMNMLSGKLPNELLLKLQTTLNEYHPSTAAVNNPPILINRDTPISQQEYNTSDA